MESEPQNPEFRNNPENFHSCGYMSKLFYLVPGKFFMLFCHRQAPR